MTHCRSEEAEKTVHDIEADVAAETGKKLEPVKTTLTVHPRKSFGLGMIFASMFGENRARSVLALTLMVAQSFLYNSVFSSATGSFSRIFITCRNSGSVFICCRSRSEIFCGPLCSVPGSTLSGAER